jgi:hypothetical protein
VLEIQAMWSPDLSPCPIPEFIEKHWVKHCVEIIIIKE